VRPLSGVIGVTRGLLGLIAFAVWIAEEVRLASVYHLASGDFLVTLVLFPLTLYLGRQKNYRP
jgi:hypothetical protein